MLPGPVSKAITCLAVSAGGNRRQIRDASDVLQDPAALGVGKQHIVEQGNKRRALSAVGHIGWAKIGDDRNARLRGDRSRLARLPCAGKAFACVRLSTRLVIKRLPVTADQIES